MDAVSSRFMGLWKKVSSSLQEVSQQYDAEWLGRKRSVDSLMLVLLIMKVAISKNRQGYGSTIQNFWDEARELIPRLRFLNPIAASTFAEARLKLSENIFLELNTKIIKEYEKERGDQHLWLERRVFAVDGSRLNLPKELMASGFAPPSSKAFYPQGKISCLYNLKSRLPYDFQINNHMDERKGAIEHLEKLGEGDVVVYDRGYLSYALLNQHQSRQIDAVFRLKPTHTFLAIQQFAKGNEREKIVNISLTNRPTRKARKQFPNMEIRPIPLRLIKYKVKGKIFYLGTTLLDTKKFPAESFADLYHSRWGIEELFKISKRVIEIEDFHAKSERGVKQEIFAHFLFLTLTRILSNNADRTVNDKNPKKNHSFHQSLRRQLQKLHIQPERESMSATTIST